MCGLRLQIYLNMLKTLKVSNLKKKGMGDGGGVCEAGPAITKPSVFSEELERNKILSMSKNCKLI